MAKLKQRPQNFAQNFAILTQKRQITYLDSDDGNNSDDDDVLPSRNPQKKHKMNDHHKIEGSPAPDPAPREEVSEEPLDTLEESEDDITPILRPRYASAPPALGRTQKGRKAHARQSGKSGFDERTPNDSIVAATINGSTTPSEDQDGSTVAVVSKQNSIPNQDPAAPRSSSPPNSRELSPDASPDDQASSDDLEFQVFENRKASLHAYLIKHIDETIGKAGQAWQAAKELQSVKNNEDIGFKVNDIINVFFDSGPVGTAKIREIRETSTIFVLLQWMYTRTEAVRAGATKNKVKAWPPRTYMLSNHFQVVTNENLESMSDVTVDEKMYWDATGKMDLRPMSEIVKKLDKQGK